MRCVLWKIEYLRVDCVCCWHQSWKWHVTSTVDHVEYVSMIIWKCTSNAPLLNPKWHHCQVHSLLLDRYDRQHPQNYPEQALWGRLYLDFWAKWKRFQCMIHDHRSVDQPLISFSSGTTARTSALSLSGIHALECCPCSLQSNSRQNFLHCHNVVSQCKMIGTLHPEEKPIISEYIPPLKGSVERY